MTTQQFIEKAIEGGWQQEGMRMSFGHESFDVEVCFYEALLSPLAWQAVGKVEGKDVWEGVGEYKDDDAPGNPSGKKYGVRYVDWKWKDKMHRMIDALDEGKSVEEYLQTL